MPELHAAAAAALARLTSRAAAAGLPCARAELVEGDLLRVDLAPFDLVLCTSICFGEALLAALQRRAWVLRPRARLVLMHKAFDFEVQEEAQDGEEGVVEEAEGRAGAGAKAAEPLGWLRRLRMREDAEPEHEVLMQMSFGEARFYVYERVESGQAPL